MALWLPVALAVLGYGVAGHICEPGEDCWPSEADWQQPSGRQLGGQENMTTTMAGPMTSMPENTTTEGSDTSMPEQQVVVLSLTMTVPDTSHFCTGSEYYASLVASLQMAVALNVDGISVEDVAAVFDCSPDSRARRLTGSVAADVTITPPAATSANPTPVTADQVSTAVNALAPATLSDAYVAQVQADTSLPNDVRSQYTTDSVSVDAMQAAVQTAPMGTTMSDANATSTPEDSVTGLAVMPSSQLAAAATLLTLAFAA